MSHAVVVVPCYNEAKRLDALRFQQFVETHADINFLLVNDGSRDETWDLLQRMQSTRPSRISALNLLQNSGKAEAVRRGCLAALETQADFVGFWDADLATPLEDIPRFCEVLQRRTDIELVVGVRLPLLGHRIERKRLRRVLGRMFAATASTALGLTIYDTQCGAKLFRVSPTFRSVLSEPFLTRWIFDVEMLSRWICLGLPDGVQALSGALYEFPLEHWRDVAGSKLKASDFPRAFIELGRIYARYLRPGARWQPTLSPVPNSRPTRKAA